ncbi:MAG: S41 family peptidase [Hyphomonadaceae bacterium]
MKRLILAFALVCATVSSAVAQSANTAASWRDITRADVEAAYQLLTEDHPALSRTINDMDFRERLEAGRVLALQRAEQVRTIEGYFATMAGFANVAGDKHIWWRSPYLASTTQWAGLIITRRGDSYVVFSHQGAEEGASLEGATLLSCDGVSANDFAEQKLGGFSAVWSIEAQRIQRAPTLLIDGGNPFVLRPTQCEFMRGPRRILHTLQWREIQRTELSSLVRPALNRGAAGYGVRPFDGGMWIALQGLDDEATAVVAQVREQQAQLRAAPVVVLDMRGNGGGNSDYGAQIARVLFGEARFNQVYRGGGEDCSTTWRVSPRNLETMRSYVTRFAVSNPDFARGMRELVRRAERAQASGEEFTGRVACGGDRAAPDRAPTQVASGRIVLLTDNTCFSSCLIVTDMFRRLGALHVGQATDAATHYMEVREERLPSGLSYFSTLQAFSPSSPAQMGPYEPEIRYDADISNTPELEAWVAQVAAPGQR